MVRLDRDTAVPGSMPPSAGRGLLHAGGKEYRYRSTLGSLQRRLDTNLFDRVHRSAAVNARRIRELTLSRKYRPQLEAWLRQPL
jgi:LytTr DNA-binding domain-containing protein